MNVTGSRPGHAGVNSLPPLAPGHEPKPDHAQDDHDLPRLNRLRERTHALMRKKTRDDAPPYAPLKQSPLAQDISNHFQLQRRYDHNVGLDQIGPASFTQRRSAALHKIPGARATALQYGQSFAVDMRKEPPYPRLRIGNDEHAVYHREVPGKGFHAALKALYDHKHKLPNGYDVAFVSGEHSLAFLNSLIKGLPEAANVPPSIKMAPGIIALHFPPYCAKRIGTLVELLGARPSPYQVRRALGAEPTPLQPDPRVNNRQIISPLMASNPHASSRRLRLSQKDEGTGALAHAAADLVDDLCNVLTTSGLLEHHRHNPLLAQGLIGLHTRLEDMNALHNDSARFGNAYRAMMEELHVVLTAVRPYGAENFKAAALRHLELTTQMDVALASRLKKPEAFLATSAMNAIWQGLEVAGITSAEAGGKMSFKPLATKRHGETPIYYEVEHLMRYTGHTFSDTSRTLLATLNNSFPEASGHKLEPWGVQAVIDATRTEVAKHKAGEAPFTLVLDTTVEHHDDLKELTHKLGNELTTGKLQIAVCKSYQKFSNLCSSKVMAGSITLLGTDGPTRQKADGYLASIERNTAWMANDEAQLMTHMLRGGQHEFHLLKRAVDNAEFVRNTCFKGEGEHASFDGYYRRLPFGMIAKHDEDDDFEQPELTIRNAAGTEETRVYGPTDNIDPHRVRPRDSFGFSETVTAHMPLLDGYDSEAMRVSFGQESKAELTEMFYMPSRLMLAEGSGFSTDEALQHVNELVRDGLTPEQRSATAQKSLAHKLVLIGANEAPRLSDKDRLEGTVASMRRTLEHQNVGQAFTLNKVTSVVGHLGSLTLSQGMMDRLAGGVDRKAADLLVDGLMSSNMPGVSRTGRETIARFHAALCEADMHSNEPARRQKGVERLVDGLERMHVASTRGAYIKCVPDAVFGAQSVELRQRVLDLVFRPLSTAARLALINRQLRTHQLSFAESCIDMAEREDAGRTPHLANHIDQQRTVLAQERLKEQTQTSTLPMR
jgi:hypothetical protein